MLINFSKLTFSKNSIRFNIRVSNSLGTAQARPFVRPGLVPICLKKLSIDDTSRQIWVLLHRHLRNLARAFSTCMLRLTAFAVVRRRFFLQKLRRLRICAGWAESLSYSVHLIDLDTQLTLVFIAYASSGSADECVHMCSLARAFSTCV